MAKGAYIGAPLTEVMTSNNIGSWFTLSDPDSISSWNGATLTVTGISSNERVKLTALRDMTVSFDYTTDSFCKISFKGQYICDNGDDGHYTATLEAGKYFYFSNSSAVSSQTCTLTNITCTSATSVAHKIKKGYVGVPKNILSEPSAMTLSGTSVSNGVISFPVNGSIALIQQSVAVPVASHKYYTRLAYNAPSGLSSTVINVQMWANDYAGGYITFYSAATFPVQDGQWRTLSAVREAPSSPASGSWVFRSYVYAGNVACQMKELFLIDLTAIFGVGNEPSKEWCDANVGYSVGNGESVSVARKIKKAYIGIGGVARPCWSGGELAYYGTITPLSKARTQLAATSVGDFALFGGGAESMSTIDAYNTTLTRSTPKTMYGGGYTLSATTVGNYALFAAGRYSDSLVGYEVDAYDSSLTRTTPTGLSQARTNAAATTVGNYALFGGGRTSSDASSVRAEVDAYNASLTRTSAINLTNARASLQAGTVGDYAVFYSGQNTGATRYVDFYNSSLTHTSINNAEIPMTDSDSASVGNYVIFAGAGIGSTTAIACDASLTFQLLDPLSTRRTCVGTTVGDFALFGGGASTDATVPVDVYDASLTRTVTNSLSSAKDQLAATTVGNYALFGGGRGLVNYSWTTFATVDAYTVA